MNAVHTVNMGRTSYRDCWRLQHRLFGLRSRNAIGDVLLLTEHEPVYTLGTAGKESHLLADEHTLRASGADVVHVDRGGDITFHGPGQLVGYPILQLSNYRTDLHWYLRQLEEVVLRVLAHFGVKGTRDPDYTGVWIGSEKVCAIGVRSRQWVTMHGFALNVSTDLKYFRHIIPCGIFERGVTTLCDALGGKVELPLVSEMVTAEFGEVFVTTMNALTLQTLESLSETFERTPSHCV
jgi:lipoate-protein ligase B